MTTQNTRHITTVLPPEYEWPDLSRGTPVYDDNKRIIAYAKLPAGAYAVTPTIVDGALIGWTYRSPPGQQQSKAVRKRHLSLVK